MEGLLAVCQRRLQAHPEPEKPPGPAGADVAVLRFTLASGTKLQRRFLASDTLALVRDFVVVATADVRGGTPCAAFDLALSFPKRTFNTHEPDSPHLKLTLREAQMHPQAVLFVQEL